MAGLLRALRVSREDVWPGENRGPGTDQQRRRVSRRDREGAAWVHLLNARSQKPEYKNELIIIIIKNSEWVLDDVIIWTIM